MHTVKILGMILRDYSIREALRKSDEFLKDGTLNLITFISAAGLLLAADNPEQQEWLESADMVLFGETEILKAAGVDSRNRVREVENKEFFSEFLRKLVKYHSFVYLLGNTQQELTRLETDLSSYQGGLAIVGKAAVREYENIDSLINEINDKAPRVIISRFEYPQDMTLISKCRMLVNAEMWVAIPDNLAVSRIKEIWPKRLYKSLNRRMFNSKVDKYKGSSQKEEQ